MNPPPVSPEIARALAHIRGEYEKRYAREPVPVVGPYVQPTAPIAVAKPHPISLTGAVEPMIARRRTTLPFPPYVLRALTQTFITAVPIEPILLHTLRLSLETARAVDVDDITISLVSYLENGPIDGRAFVDFEDEDLAAFYRTHPQSRRPTPSGPVTFDVLVYPSQGVTLKLTNRTGAAQMSAAWFTGDAIDPAP